ncbi:HNH endonuclease [Marinoscillum luteum]|uniref:HNH endonuclease n=1 Tax=Marinoscillum luteum TaxID=861051 RepID=A0ABW7NBA8_9BACT
MIQITSKDLNQVPEALSSQGAFRKILKAITQITGQVYNGHHYRHNDVLQRLKAFSVHKQHLEKGDKPKCYYCESAVEHVAKLQVEHYRPKAKVDDIDNNNTPHHGYYWLGLEWSNLLLACPNCNGKDAKGNRFPLRDFNNRATVINPIGGVQPNLTIDRTHCLSTCENLNSEEPLLINPENTDPSIHLSFNNQGQIMGITDEGRTSVVIFKLDRDPLFAARQGKINDIIDDINLAIAANKKGRVMGDSLIVWLESSCQRLLDRNDVSKEYTLWIRYVIDHFENCIVNKIDPSYRDSVRTAFNNVNNP